MKKFLSLLCVAIIGISNLAYADDFEVDKIRYKILSETDRTVEISNSYISHSDIIIPSTVEFNNIEYTVTTIGDKAFGYKKVLNSVTFPSSLIYIGKDAFESCSSLKEIIFPELCQPISIGEGAFSNCTSLSLVYLPKSITSIGKYAFSGCKSLNSVTFPESLISIEDCAFWMCESLTSLTFPNPCSLTSIGNSAFSYCSSLNLISFPESLSSIGDWAFTGTSLKSVTFPMSLTSIAESAFNGCKSLNSVIFPKSLTSIGARAFSGTNLTIINFPESLTYIGECAFYSCESLTNVIFPRLSRLTSIENAVFADCPLLNSIILPYSLYSIGTQAFENCKTLTSVTFPEGLTLIENWAFSGCHELTSVIFPESLTLIGEKVFNNCPNIIWVENHRKEPQDIEYNVFDFNIYQQATLRVPDEYIDIYKKTGVWSLFQNITGGAWSRIEDVAIDDLPVTVYTLSGVEVYSGKWDERAELPAGIYVVRYADGSSTKIAVR